MILKTIFLFFLFLLSISSFGQLVLKIECKDCGNKSRVELSVVKDSLQAKDVLFSRLNNYYLKGYAESGFDSVIYSQGEIHAYFSEGRRFFWKEVVLLDIENDVILFQKHYKRRIFSRRNIKALIDKSLSSYENTGYPFAKVTFKEIKLINNQISSSLILEKGKFFTIDSIINKGDAKISKYFIEQYLDVFKGEPYNESHIKNLSVRAAELVFVQEKKPFEVIFKENSVDIYTYFNKKKANQFYGILGVLPNNNTQGKLLLTGDINLFLINSFSAGEWIKFNWAKPGVESQKLYVGFDYPFIYKFPLGLKLDFDLYKKDSSYVNISGKYGLKFKIRGKMFLHAFIKRESGALINTNGFEYLTALPENIDYKSSIAGVGVTGDNFDYFYNPTKGYEIEFYAGAGKKTIKRNASLPEILFENVDLNSSTYEIYFSSRYYLPISKKGTLKFSAKSGQKINSNLFKNELFRLGGLKTIRGFDEESIFASSYYLLSLEPRYIFEKNSALFLFGDFGRIESETSEQRNLDYPIGMGIGTEFETKSGIFSVSYAVGRQQGNPFVLRSAKIHFGYVNRF